MWWGMETEKLDPPIALKLDRLLYVFWLDSSTLHYKSLHKCQKILPPTFLMNFSKNTKSADVLCGLHLLSKIILKDGIEKKPHLTCSPITFVITSFLTKFKPVCSTTFSNNYNSNRWYIPTRGEKKHYNMCDKSTYWPSFPPTLLSLSSLSCVNNHQLNQTF